MRFCSSCGHELGVGRFCTNCGQPVDGSPRPTPQTGPPTGAQVVPPAPRAAEQHGGDAGPDTQERRAARREAALSPGPARTPPAADVPPPPRFPLYADEAPDEPVTRTDLAAAPSTHPGASWGDPDDTDSGLLGRFAGEQDEDGRTPEQALASLRRSAEGRERGTERWETRSEPAGTSHRRAWPWLVALLVLVVAVAGAGVVWWRTQDDTTATDTTAAAEATELVSEATVEAPGRARPSRELGGGRVTYVAANMLDGDPSTAWRVAGNAAGDEIVLTFPERVTVSEVGLVNGYAKVGTNPEGQEVDWYHGHRVITRVVWVFDDRTEVRQDLVRSREPQTIPVDDLTTRSLTLRLVDVSAPGTGRASRDFTAISDLTVLGDPG